MRGRDSGFTLLEMLVALVVFGLVMAGLTQTFRYGLSAWSAANRRAPASENLAAMDAALARMIAQAQPGSLTGRADDLAFTTRLPAGAGLKTGLADAAIMLAPDGTLTLRYGAHPPGVPLVHPPAPRTEPLAQGVAALKFSYLAPRDSGPPSWSDVWEDGGLPLLIRVHLELASGQSWPDLVAAPMASGN
jgi:general secretion pathway protein J